MWLGEEGVGYDTVQAVCGVWSSDDFGGVLSVRCSSRESGDFGLGLKREVHTSSAVCTLRTYRRASDSQDMSTS